MVFTPPRFRQSRRPVFVALLSLLTTITSSNSQEWQIEVIDSAGNVGEYTSLALDASGFPHISYDSYQDTGGYHLRYASKNGSGWQIETIDSQVDAGGHSSLAFDAERYPHISYYDRGNATLKYAYAEPGIFADVAPGTALPGDIRLLSASPNPAATQTSILSSLGVGCHEGSRRVSIMVYDCLGRLVATAFDGRSFHGASTVSWDLRSDRGYRLPSGTYLLSIRATNPEAADAMKLVIAK